MTENLHAPFGEVLHAFRRRTKVHQQWLADQLGVHRNTIGAWERGDRLPESRGMVLELAKYLHLDEQETQQLLEASLMTLTHYWVVPAARNPFFTGRRDLLMYLHGLLHHSSVETENQSYALCGLSGIGKTQLALEYVYQYAQQYHAVFWITAETIHTLTASFFAIAERLHLIEEQERPQQSVISAVRTWLDTHKGWLLVFDNVEQLSILKTFFPSAQHGIVLITTRHHTLEGMAQCIDVPAFSPQESLRFLLMRARLIDGNGEGDELTLEQHAAAMALVERMDGLPLALDQVGAYVERSACTFTDYLQLYQHHALSLLDDRPGIAEHPLSVVKTFQLSFTHLAQVNAAAADLLRVCTFLAPDAIPEEIFTQTATQLGSSLAECATHPLSFNQMVGELLHASLLIRDAQNHTLFLHRLVQEVLQSLLSADEKILWGRRVILALTTLFPTSDHPHTWPRCERLLPHIHACIPLLQDPHIACKEAAQLLNQAGHYLFERGRYQEVEPLFQQSLSIREQVLGPEHPDVAESLNDLAVLYDLQGNYTRAEPLYARVLAICEQELGPEHPDVALFLNNMAELCREQGKYTEAEPLLLRALSIGEQALGPDHPDVALFLNNTAKLYREQGKYSEAETLCLRAITIREQKLGPRHPDVAFSINDLAELYHLQGKEREAEPLYLRALAIREEVQGPKYLGVAFSAANLAECYRAQGNYTQAEHLCVKALRIQEYVLDPVHPYRAIPLLSMANLYRDQDKPKEAEPLYLHALHLQEQALGPNHPKVATVLQDMAILRQRQRRIDDALSLSQRALHIRQCNLGNDHPLTQRTVIMHQQLIQALDA